MLSPPPPRPGGDGSPPRRTLRFPADPHPGTLPTFPWGSRQAAKSCCGGVGCSNKPFSSPRPSPPSQQVRRTLPTLSPSAPSIPTARHSRLCRPGEVWQFGR